MWVFVNCLIENPTFDSQTKETLTLQSKSFGSTCSLPDSFINKVSPYLTPLHLPATPPSLTFPLYHPLHHPYITPYIPLHHPYLTPPHPYITPYIYPTYLHTPYLISYNTPPYPTSSPTTAQSLRLTSVVS